METPVTFNPGGQQIVGMLHVPAKRRDPVPAVVMFHGFTGNRVESHRMFVKLSRGLEGAGIASLRFDFRGSGDSAGEFSEMTVTREIADGKAALRFMRKREEVDNRRLGILGMSLGGIVAAAILGTTRGIRAGALWGAVARPGRRERTRMDAAARRQLKEMGVFDNHGFAVGPDFIKDLPTHKPLEMITNRRVPMLVLHGENDETVPVAAAHAYERALKKADVPVLKHIVAGADHTFASLPWETEVLAATLAWFRKHLMGC